MLFIYCALKHSTARYKWFVTVTVRVSVSVGAKRLATIAQSIAQTPPTHLLLTTTHIPTPYYTSNSSLLRLSVKELIFVKPRPLMLALSAAKLVISAQSTCHTKHDSGQLLRRDRASIAQTKPQPTI